MAEVAGSWLAEPSRAHMGEWSYGQADRILLAEEMLGTPGTTLLDYKFFVFAGEVTFCRLTDLGSKPKRVRWYDVEWTPTNYLDSGYALHPVTEPPDTFREMVDAAELLGDGFDFIRVDLFDVGGAAVFGELTPYHAGGLKSMDPRLDKILGDAWKLPELHAG